MVSAERGRESQIYSETEMFKKKERQLDLEREREREREGERESDIQREKKEIERESCWWWKPLLFLGHRERVNSLPDPCAGLNDLLHSPSQKQSSTQRLSWKNPRNWAKTQPSQIKADNSLNSVCEKKRFGLLPTVAYTLGETKAKKMLCEIKWLTWTVWEGVFVKDTQK